MESIKNVIIGMFIGAGAIVPGVSSGVICVILGIYEKLLDSVLNILKDFKKNIKFLLPIGLGVLIGMVLFGKVLNYLFYAYPIQINSTFIGLIIGSLPALIKETKKESKFRLQYINFLLVSLIIGVSMIVLEKRMAVSSGSEFSFLYLVFSGICMSIGIIIPGVSSTVILMLLGVYSAYLTSIAGVYLPVLIPMGIGVFIGSLICMKLIKVLLDRFYMQTYYSIIGFTIGSAFIMFPGITFDITGLISLLCFLLGCALSSKL